MIIYKPVSNKSRAIKGQAKKFVSIGSILAEKGYLSNNSSTKAPLGLQNQHYCMPTS
jgi:hypothetical protein